MKVRKFVGQILNLTRRNCPGLYGKHIKGRRAAFVAERAPTEETRERRVGYINKDLRMLFSLAMMFEDAGIEITRPFEGKEISTPIVCRVAGGVAQSTIGVLCLAAFLKFVRERFKVPSDNFVSLNPDWSVTVSTREELDQMGIKPYPMTDLFLYLIRGQMDINDMMVDTEISLLP